MNLPALSPLDPECEGVVRFLATLDHPRNVGIDDEWIVEFEREHLSTCTRCQAHHDHTRTPVWVPLGRIVGTPGALRLLEDRNVTAASLLARHVVGDWGDLSPDDVQANDRALIDGDRLVSAYDLPNGGKVWIITEWDRTVTTVLLPEDY